MGWRIAEEVQEHAPASLTWRELYVACVLANAASEHTRVCRPGLLTDEALMRRLRMSHKREILRVVEKLIDAKVIERVTRGQKGVQAEFRFLPLGPARPVQGGDSAHPDDVPARTQGGESTHPGDGSGWVVSPLRVGDSPAQGGGITHPSQGPNEDQSLLPSQRIVRTAGLGLTDDDEKRFIDWINKTYKPGSSAWWRKVAAEGDLPGHVDAWRKETGQSQRQHSDLPEWCGQCGDSNPAAKTNTRFRTDTGLPGGTPCPTCHPDAVPSTQQPAAARGYQPYRNPVDQSVYFEPIS